MSTQIGLQELENIIETNETIEIRKKEINIDELLVTKRSGEKTTFNFSKINKMAENACNGFSQSFIDELLQDTKVKLYNGIKTSEIQQQLIYTAVNKISRLIPDWEYIAGRLLLADIYKKAYNRFGYPHINEYIKRGFKNHLLNKTIFESYTQKELNELNEYIKQERDHLFTYNALFTIMKKYLLKTCTSKLIELPQLTYMAISMSLFYKAKNRIEKIKNLYDTLSLHNATLATPIKLNARKPRLSLSSCVLNSVADDGRSILEVGRDSGIYSGYNGGLAHDITKLRANGSPIRKGDGKSSGPVSFIKIYEQILSAFDQGGTRKGASCIYFPTWHLDFEDLIMLKNNGGVEEKRARHLQYGLKIDDIFIERLINNEDYTLFDPYDTPELTDTFGEEFKKWYLHYENKSGIRKKKLKASDIWKLFIQQRTETGNIYIFFSDEVNRRNMLNTYIRSSNLCTEVLEATNPSKLERCRIFFDEDGSEKVAYEYALGEIATCNLASFNMMLFTKSKEERVKSIRTVMDAMKEAIEINDYPLPEAKSSNRKWRYLGLGVSNWAQLLASQNIDFDSQESLEYEAKVWDELSYEIISYSNELAATEGSFPNFRYTKWAEGLMPVMNAKDEALKLTKYKPNMKKWNELANKVKREGLYFALHMAIAPTACGKYDNKLQTVKYGNLDYHEICNLYDINWKEIEEKEAIGWYEFSSPLTLKTRVGERKSNRIYYNGKKSTYKITFEDNKTYDFTYNHRLYVKNNENDYHWKSVTSLKEGSKIYNINTNLYSKISKIEKIENVTPTWDIEVDEVHEYLLDNGCVSHNTSGIAINATPGIEPILHLTFKEEGKFSQGTVLAPNIKKYGQYYRTAFECNQEMLIKHAAVRQIYIDQSQSVNMYYTPPFSLKELTYNHLLAWKLGVKTLYYFQSQKAEDKEFCESCT